MNPIISAGHKGRRATAPEYKTGDARAVLPTRSSQVQSPGGGAIQMTEQEKAELNAAFERALNPKRIVTRDYGLNNNT